MTDESMSFKLWSCRENFEAVITMVNQWHARMVLSKMLSNTRSKLPDLVAPIVRTFVRVILKKVARQFTRCFERVARTAIGARHFASRRFVLLEITFYKSDRRPSQRLSAPIKTRFTSLSIVNSCDTYDFVNLSEMLLE